MSYQIYIDGRYAADAASNHGWYEFAKWGRKQSAPALRYLCTHGEAPLALLAEDLDAVLRKRMPAEHRDIAVEMLRSLVSQKGDSVQVSQHDPRM